MRADRLVAIVLLLQTHGRLTAVELSDRLETSTRTIRRDLDALCVAGIPLYSQRGRGGGWTLLGGHRIDLTGLTSEEAQALFLATGPGWGAALGPSLSEALVAARRKAMAALPVPLRDQVLAASESVLIDSSRWGRPAGTTQRPDAAPDLEGDEHLRALRSAVISGVEVLVVYEPPGRPPEERRLQPKGLVCKRGVWYLVATAASGLRTYRISRMHSVTVTDDPTERAEGFDLNDAWDEVQQEMYRRLPASTTVQAAVEPAALRRLRATIGAWWPVEEVDIAPDGRHQVTIRFPTVSIAVAELLGLGEHVEVTAPEEVRTALAAAGRRLVDRYSPQATVTPR